MIPETIPGLRMEYDTDTGIPLDTFREALDAAIYQAQRTHVGIKIEFHATGHAVYDDDIEVDEVEIYLTGWRRHAFTSWRMGEAAIVGNRGCTACDYIAADQIHCDVAGHPLRTR